MIAETAFLDHPQKFNKFQETFGGSLSDGRTEFRIVSYYSLRCLYL